VRGPLVMTAQRVGRDLSESDIYKQALGIRPVPLRAEEGGGCWVVTEDGLNLPPPTTQPTDRFKPKEPVRMSADSVSTLLTPEGKVAAILSGNVFLSQSAANGDYMELEANRAVLFTPLSSLAALPINQQIQTIEQAITAAYL